MQHMCERVVKMMFFGPHGMSEGERHRSLQTVRSYLIIVDDTVGLLPQVLTILG